MGNVITPPDVFSHAQMVDADFTFIAATDASGIVADFDCVSFGNINKQNWGLFWLIWGTGAVDCDAIQFELKIDAPGVNGIIFPPFIENPAVDASFYFGTMEFQDGQGGAVLENIAELIYTAIDGKFMVRCAGLPTISFDRIKCELSYISAE